MQGTENRTDQEKTSPGQEKTSPALIVFACFLARIINVSNHPYLEGLYTTHKIGKFGDGLGDLYTSSTEQGGGGSFKNMKPIGELGCCDSRMAERIH